jgi:hypothetical protein
MYSMGRLCATPNRRLGRGPAWWYVPRALGESRKSARHRRRGAGQRVAVGLLAAATAVAIGACGSKPRQDASEPKGDFPVEVTKAKFPNRQQISERTDLQLAVKNVGQETIPDLAITIYTGEQKADGSFNTRLDQPNLANPNRPVWILEDQYPKLLGAGVTLNNLEKAPSAGAAAAQTDTWQFGAVAAGESKDMDWRVTPVKGGTYTVHYQVAAGLQGNARAVTRDGSPVKGEFVVTIATKPPQTCVNGQGQVTTGCGP